MSLEESDIAPRGVSPRHRLSLTGFDAISKDLQEVGHVIVENCFEKTKIETIKSNCLEFFSEYEERFQQGAMTDDERRAHLSSTRDLPVASQKQFTKTIYGSQLLDLFRFLLDSDKVIMFRNDQCLRKVNPDHPLRVVGLHYDTQFASYVDRTFTLWLPLTDILANSPTVLYLHRSLSIPFNSIDPEIRWGEETCPDESGVAYEDQKERRKMKMLDFMNQNAEKAYTPRLKTGDAIIFCHDVLHGTFLDSNAKQVRYSLDCRFSRDFDRSKNEVKQGKYFQKEIHTLYSSPGPASAIRTITFDGDRSPLYTPHESHPDVENGTPTYDGYSYAKQHKLRYDFSFYEYNMPDMGVEDIARLAIYERPARRLLRIAALRSIRKHAIPYVKNSYMRLANRIRRIFR